ncbi:MAG: TonB-dependent receptor [Sphingomonas sp.]
MPRSSPASPRRRAPSPRSTAASGATTQAGFDAIKDTIKPETSDTYELGARYNTSSFNGVLGVYLVNFQNRLLGVASGPDIIGRPLGAAERRLGARDRLRWPRATSS